MREQVERSIDRICILRQATKKVIRKGKEIRVFYRHRKERKESEERKYEKLWKEEA